MNHPGRLFFFISRLSKSINRPWCYLPLFPPYNTLFNVYFLKSLAYLPIVSATLHKTLALDNQRSPGVFDSQPALHAQKNEVSLPLQPRPSLSTTTKGTSTFPTTQLPSSQFVESAGAVLFHLSTRQICHFPPLPNIGWLLPKGRRNCGKSPLVCCAFEETNGPLSRPATRNRRYQWPL